MSMFVKGFLLGALVGAIVCWYAYMIYVRYASRKLINSFLKKIKDSANNMASSAQSEQMKSAEIKLRRVNEIQERILIIKQRLEYPSKNAVDSKYKNDLIQEAKHLQDELIETLNSILRDGVDPSVPVVRENGTVDRIRLSQFLEEEGYLYNSSPKKEEEIKPSNPVKTKPHARQVGKFTVWTNIPTDDNDSGTNE